MESPGNRVMYYLLDGPERAFVSKELMLIPEDTELMISDIATNAWLIDFCHKAIKP